MRRKDWAAETHEAFERGLLLSAHADTGPKDTEQAWQRLQGALALVTLDPIRRGELDSSESLTADKPTATRFRRTRVGALIALGAVAGSLATALAMLAWQQTSPQQAPTRPVPSATAKSQPAASAVAVPDVHEAADTRTRARGAGPSVDALATPQRPRRPRPEKHTNPAQLLEPAPIVSNANDASKLRAQVALVDAARAAISGGAYSSALRLVERFHREFPQAELAPDADTLAIEALAAEGASGQLAEQVERFLAHYPDDPHAARVKAIAARAPQP